MEAEGALSCSHPQLGCLAQSCEGSNRARLVQKQMQDTTPVYPDKKRGHHVHWPELAPAASEDRPRRSSVLSLARAQTAAPSCRALPGPWDMAQEDPARQVWRDTAGDQTLQLKQLLYSRSAGV